MQPEEKQMCIYRNSLPVSTSKRKRAHSILICLPLHAMRTAEPDKVLTGENKFKIFVKIKISFVMKVVVFGLIWELMT